MRLLVIGWDGATFDVIKPLVAQGRLPNIARLMKEGAWGNLRSTVPPISPSAWTTFATGKNPGQHGVFDFQYLSSDYSWQPRPSQWHQHKSIWQLLSENNRRVAAIDVPFTYPPQAVNGIMVSGYPTPRSEETVFTYPQDLPQQLAADGFTLELGWPKARIDVHPDFFSEWEQVMQDREQLLTHLYQREAWDVFMVVFGVTDTLAHTLWHYLDPSHPAYYDEKAAEYREVFLNCYEQCDRVLGRLWSMMDDDSHLLMLSDHGFGSIRPRQWLISFLLERGWVAFQQPTGLGGVVSPLRKMALRAYTNLGWLRRWIRELRPDSKGMLKQALSQGGLLTEMSNLDYTRSFVIPSDMGTHLYLNRQGRFENGLLDKATGDQFLEEIRQALVEARDPIDGEPIVSAVYRYDEVYSGYALPDSPDLIVEYRNYYKPYHETPPPTNPNITSGHAPEGILLGWGPGITAGEIAETDIVNMAPTMLHLLGETVPPDMDGIVLKSMLHQKWLQQHPVQWGDTPAVNEETSQESYSAAEQAEVEEQLRALGYID